MPHLTETPGFVPISEWPTLHDLCEGFSKHLMPDSHRLSGRHLELVFENGPVIDHHFVDGQNLKWLISGEGEQAGLSGTARYRAFEVRPDIFFVDFYKVDYEEEVSIIINITSGGALIAVSGFDEQKGSKRTKTTFFNAHLTESALATPFETTQDLIGKHVVYRYTPEDTYEHVYLNQGTFTWHCLSGTETGLADTEPCKMLKLDEQLYLLFWTEKIMPVESVVVIDLHHMRSTGRFFCWDPKPGKAVRTLFGSYATLLADTGVDVRGVSLEQDEIHMEVVVSS